MAAAGFYACGGIKEPDLARYITVFRIWKILASWIQPKTTKNNCFTLKTRIYTFEKREIIKISLSLSGSSSFIIKISEKRRKII